MVATHKIFGARFTAPQNSRFSSNDVRERTAGTVSDPLLITPSNVLCPTARKIVGNQLPNSLLVSLAEAPLGSPQGSVIPGSEDLQKKKAGRGWKDTAFMESSGVQNMRPTGRVSALWSTFWPEDGRSTKSP